MPEFLSEPQRWVIPAVLIASAVGVPVALMWERMRPSVPAHVEEMRAWRELSASGQAAADAEALAEGAAADGFDAAVWGRLEERARLAELRAAEINAQLHP